MGESRRPYPILIATGWNRPEADGYSSMFEDRAIAEQIFKIYVSRVFSLVVLPGKRIALENYDYLTRFRLLADELRSQSEPQAARRLPTFYALQLLDGKR